MTITNTMQAAILDGPNMAFRVKSIARPQPKAGQVLIRIKANEVTPLDTKIHAGSGRSRAASAAGRSRAERCRRRGNDTVGGAVLDASFTAVGKFGHVVSALGWGTHSLAPLSFRAATYSGIFTLLPMLTGDGRARHGKILREATEMAEAGKIVTRIDTRHFTLDTVLDAYEALKSRTATGRL